MSSLALEVVEQRRQDSNLLEMTVPVSFWWARTVSFWSVCLINEWMNQRRWANKPTSSVLKMSISPAVSVCFTGQHLDAVTSGDVSCLFPGEWWLCLRSGSEYVTRFAESILNLLPLGWHRARLQPSCSLFEGSKVHILAIGCFSETWLNWKLLSFT